MNPNLKLYAEAVIRKLELWHRKLQKIVKWWRDGFRDATTERDIFLVFKKRVGFGSPWGFKKKPLFDAHKGWIWFFFFLAPFSSCCLSLRLFYTGQRPDVLAAAFIQASVLMCLPLFLLQASVLMCIYCRKGRRLGAPMGAGCWQRRVPRGGSSPSPLWSPVHGNERRLLANACMAALVSIADQRASNAAVVDGRRGAGTVWALDGASNLRNCAASSLHRPPNSRASATNLQRPEPSNSGYVRSFARLASLNAVPAYAAYVPALLLGWPLLVRGETRVVSMASWVPFHSGSPFAITSIRLSSWWWTAWIFKSAMRVFVVTLAPASRQMRAAACSRGPPLLRNTPDLAHAAWWSPSWSTVRRHLQERWEKGNGSRRRLNMSKRNKWDGYVVSSVYGIVVKARLA